MLDNLTQIEYILIILNNLNYTDLLISMFRQNTHININSIDTYANMLNTPTGINSLINLYQESKISLRITETHLTNIHKQLENLIRASEFFMYEDHNNFFAIAEFDELNAEIELYKIQDEYFSNILLEKRNFCETIDILQKKILTLKK